MTWEPRIGSKIVLLAGGVGLVAFGVWMVALGITEQDAVAGAVLGFAVGLIPAVIFLAAALRPRIEVSEDRLSIRNLLGWRHIGWEEVTGAASGYWGIRVATVEGRSITAIAVQKSNAFKWADVQTRADDVVSAIRDRASGER